MKESKKVKTYSEVNYLLSIILLALAVCMTKAANFGMSMIVAPAFILSEKISFLSFGVSEYIIQGILLISFCILVKKIRFQYVSAFFTSIIYGFVLDLFGSVIPIFNPEIISYESIPLALRILLFVVGCILTTFSVALSFHTYILPQMVDFFVSGITNHFNLKLGKFKTIFDLSYFALALIMTLSFFGELHGVGVGTLIMALTGGSMIGFFDRMITKYTDRASVFSKAEKYFKL